MTPFISHDPILRHFRAALEALYGDQIDRILLYGSRARGDAREDSDYDIAIFLKNIGDAWAERRRLADLRLDFLDRTGVFIDVKPFGPEDFTERSPLMHEILQQGIKI